MLLKLIYLFVSINVIFQSDARAGSRQLGTGAVTQIEGSSGSGLLPWATIAGYAENKELDINFSASYFDTGDYQFNMRSAAIGWNNRLELSYAQQKLDLTKLGPLIGLPNAQLEQEIFGAKVRLTGNLLYTKRPQISIGIQFKRNKDFTIAQSVGAIKQQGVDFYLSASHLFLSKPFGFNGFATFNLRYSKANETGLLGFGGDKNNSYQLSYESSLGAFVSKNIAIGLDFRQKHSQLNFANEDDWRDIFIAYIPNKKVSFTLAYLDLGSIASLSNQKGFYFSFSGVF